MLQFHMSGIKVRISVKIGLDLTMKTMSRKEFKSQEQPGNLAINFNAAIATTMTNTKKTNTEYFNKVCPKQAVFDFTL